MLDTLMASRPLSMRGRYSQTGVVSLIGHVTAGLLIVYATSAPPEGRRQLFIDTTMVFISDARAAETKPPELDKDQPIDARTLVVDVVPKGFQTIPIIGAVPTGIPPVDASQRFDPRDYSGVGVEGGIADGKALPPLEPGTTVVYAPAAVEELPELLHAPVPSYPALLRDAGVGGTVMLEFVVNAEGRVEATTIHVVSCSHPAFQTPSMEAIRQAVFKPGRVNGRAVRVLVRIPLTFTIKHS